MPSITNGFESLENPRDIRFDQSWPDLLSVADRENKSHFWGRNPKQLITKSRIDPGGFIVGNGFDIYASNILPMLENAQHEIIFVTCFWAPSPCLDNLGQTLMKLSQQSLLRGADSSRLRVRLCLSSRSLTQKLFHPSSADGYIYKPREWVTELGLPAPEALAGLDLQVKSLFFLPFSVMHPKFVIIDRKLALFPSCNLSHESWFEGCIPLSGPVVDRLISFWQETWSKKDVPPLAINTSRADMTAASTSSPTTTLLPSPHHRSPHFRPFLPTPKPPQTPLNVYLTDLIAKAKSTIKILTPNLTCQFVIHSLLAALARGVDVTIITNRRMMVLEQILTAGTLTEFCVWRLKRRYRNLLDRRSNSNPEYGHLREIGNLSVGYFRPTSKYAKSHLKCTIVDERTVVLGSGNMDRASWYTSQELGVAVDGKDIVREVWEKVELELGSGDMEWVEWV